MKAGEAIAKRVLEAMLPGAKLAYRVEQSHREYDFDLRYADGASAAVEVTMAVDETLMKTLGDIRGKRAGGRVIQAVACKESWSIYAANGARIDQIRKKADQLLAKLEDQSIYRFDCFDLLKPRCPQAIQELCQLGVEQGMSYRALEKFVPSPKVKPTSAGKPMIRINSPIRGGVVGNGLAIIQAGEARMEDNREKLGAAETAERHLVVYVHPLSNAQPSTFLVSEPPKETLPKLPAEITDIWLIGNGGNEDEFVVWRASTNEPWRSMSVQCAPEMLKNDGSDCID